jgi:23S rRNA (guanine745-N1)-methyltransferase
MPVTLLCTVRECRQPLVEHERQLICTRGHSFDIARSGYCNLLQPQDRRSSHPGDSREAVAARRRFLDSGHAEPLQLATVDLAMPFAGGAALDVGCGEGHHLAAIKRGSDAQGIDISVPAVEAAAKRYRDCVWIVANADRFLPYPAGSFGLVMSINARLSARELRRVVSDRGRLLVAIPTPDDLLELRAAILGSSEERDRVERTVATFAEGFELERRERIRHVARLDRAAIGDVMMSSYRGLRTRERERLDELDEMDVTLGRDLLLFRPT